MPRKMSEKHAAIRTMQRYEGTASFHELRRLISAGDFTFLARLTTTRSMCCAYAQDTWIYFVYNRKQDRVVTVLTEEQVSARLSSHRYAMSKINKFTRKESVDTNSEA